MPRKASNNKSSDNKSYKRFDDIKLSTGAELKNIFYFPETENFVFSWDGGEGIVLYDMKVLHKKDNANEWFISPPQRKGSDGKYYGYYYVEFEAGEKSEIIGELLKKID